MALISKSEAGKRLDVPTRTVTYWIDSGIFGDVKRVGTTYLLNESDVARIAQLNVLCSVDQLNPTSRDLLRQTGLLVFRLVPEHQRDDYPNDIMGFHIDTLTAGSRQGYIRYWQIGDGTWASIEENIERFGGQPVIYTLKGLCVDQCNIIDGFRPQHEPTKWQFQLEDAGNWAQDFINTRVFTRPGGQWEWWIEPPANSLTNTQV